MTQPSLPLELFLQIAGTSPLAFYPLVRTLRSLALYARYNSLRRLEEWFSSPDGEGFPCLPDGSRSGPFDLLLPDYIPLGLYLFSECRARGNYRRGLLEGTLSAEGKDKVRANYFRGLLHGPFEEERGEERKRGRYVLGRKIGRWVDASGDDCRVVFRSPNDHRREEEKRRRGVLVSTSLLLSNGRSCDFWYDSGLLELRQETEIKRGDDRGEERAFCYVSTTWGGNGSLETVWRMWHPADGKGARGWLSSYQDGLLISVAFSGELCFSERAALVDYPGGRIFYRERSVPFSSLCIDTLRPPGEFLEFRDGDRLCSIRLLEGR